MGASADPVVIPVDGCDGSKLILLEQDAAVDGVRPVPGDAERAGHISVGHNVESSVEERSPDPEAFPV